jgi:hypothetical protein
MSVWRRGAVLVVDRHDDLAPGVGEIAGRRVVASNEDRGAVGRAGGRRRRADVGDYVRSWPVCAHRAREKGGRLCSSGSALAKTRGPESDGPAGPGERRALFIHKGRRSNAGRSMLHLRRHPCPS